MNEDTANTTGIYGLDMPEMFTILESAFIRLQSRYLNLSRLEIVLFLVTSLLTIPNWRYHGVDVSLISASTTFALALILQAYLALSDLETRWHKLRDGAEQIKSLSWRFVMRAQPFDADSFDTDVNQFDYIAPQIYAAAGGKRSERVTSDVRSQAEMLRVYNSSLASREETYRHDRLTNQLDWYVRKSITLSRRASFSDTMFAVLQVLALAGLTARAFGVLGLDIYSVAAAVGAMNASWGQIRQARRLSREYRQQAEDIAAARRLLAQTAEQDWAKTVPEIEEILTGIPSAKLILYGMESSPKPVHPRQSGT